MSEAVDHQAVFAQCPATAGASPLGNSLTPRQRQDPANEQSRACARDDEFLALFLWRGVWRASFERAFSTARALQDAREKLAADDWDAVGGQLLSWLKHAEPARPEKDCDA